MHVFAHTHAHTQHPQDPFLLSHLRDPTRHIKFQLNCTRTKATFCHVRAWLVSSSLWLLLLTKWSIFISSFSPLPLWLPLSHPHTHSLIHFRFFSIESLLLLVPVLWVFAWCADVDVIVVSYLFYYYHYFRFFSLFLCLRRCRWGELANAVS